MSDFTPHADVEPEQPIFTTPQAAPVAPADPAEREEREETDDAAEAGDEPAPDKAALADAIPEVGSTVE